MMSILNSEKRFQSMLNIEAFMIYPSTTDEAITKVKTTLGELNESKFESLRKFMEGLSPKQRSNNFMGAMYWAAGSRGDTVSFDNFRIRDDDWRERKAKQTESNVLTETVTTARSGDIHSAGIAEQHLSMLLVTATEIKTENKDFYNRVLAVLEEIKTEIKK